MANGLGSLLDESDGDVVGTSTGLTEFAGPYVANMLGKGAALADQPYQAYTGPLTAGTSDLQDMAIEGVGSLVIPTDDMGAYNPQEFTADAASQYMNPYISMALEPQLRAAREEAERQRMANLGRFTSAGAYGGSRQAIMESELNRNLLQNLSDISATGYRDAYDRAVDQFNTMENRRFDAQRDLNQYGLDALATQMDYGTVARDIEQAGIDADRDQFDEERLFPYKQVQYMQSLLQNLPIETVQREYIDPSAAGELASGYAQVDQFFDDLGIDLGDIDFLGGSYDKSTA